MAEFDALIAAASWEERFELGVQRALDVDKVGSVVVYATREFSDRHFGAVERVKAATEARQIPFQRCDISYLAPTETWAILREQTRSFKEKRVLVDISTMPREIIWYLFFWLESVSASVHYVYNSPESYDSHWLSRDPDRPRLLFKMSGISRVGSPTALIAITGFDVDRVEQLMRTFEPKITLLGLQVGKQFDNEEHNIAIHRRLSDEGRVTLFEVDAYQSDHGQAEIASHLHEFLETTNVVLASLGPKLSAVALFKIYRDHPDVALVYTPSREFNPDYSKGIKQSFRGVL